MLKQAGMLDWGMVPNKQQLQIMAAIKSDKWPILLHGNAGIGKSCAAACLYCAWDRFSYWRDFSDVMNEMSGLKRADPFFYNRIPFLGFTEVDLLVLDDMGLREVSAAVQENLMYILKARYAMKTIYTSNCSPEELINAFDDRIVDRLTCGAMIQFHGDSRR